MSGTNDLTKSIWQRLKRTSLSRFCFLLITALLAKPCEAPSQPTNVAFEHFSLDQGLSGSSVRCICQDSVGYLWFGTLQGIDRFDGQSITTYRHEPGNPSSMVAAFVQTIYPDDQGTIWIGTSMGLEKFDPTSGTFTHFIPFPQLTGSTWSNAIFTILRDRSGTLWVGTGDGLNKFDPTTGTFTCLPPDTANPTYLGRNQVEAIFEDRTGSLWVGSRNGLDKLDRAANVFIHYWDNPAMRDGFTEYWGGPPHWISSIHEDRSGTLWLGTMSGLVRFDLRAGTFTRYHHDPGNPQSLSSERISSLCEDTEGRLWVGTFDAGLNVYDKTSNSFLRYAHNDHDPGSLGNDWVSGICRERSGTLWISTFWGANKLNRTRQMFTRYVHDERDPGSIPRGYPRLLNEDGNGNIWFGTEPTGLAKFEPTTGRFTRSSRGQGEYLLAKDRVDHLWVLGKGGGTQEYDSRGRVTDFRTTSGRPFRSRVMSIYEDREGRIWLAAADGLYLVDTLQNTVSTIISNTVPFMFLFEDRFGMIWAGTNEGGLWCYDRLHHSVVRYISEVNNPSSLVDNSIQDIREDRTGTMWIATNGGLHKFDRASGTFSHFTVKDGLAYNHVSSLLVDGRGWLWLATHKGISSFEPGSRRFKNYDASDGLVANQSMAWGGYKAKNGEMYFPGPNGLTRFRPDSIRNNDFVPPIVITTFRKFEQPFPIKSEIRLPYTDNSLSFEFAALNYVSPQRNQYAYRMEGLDKDWVYAGTRRYASYPHLEPGEYVFRVKGSNNDGLWNEEGVSIAITITPPFWRTWWAYATYFLITLGLLYGFRRYEMNRQQFKFNYELEKVGSAKLKELDTLKTRFFANISHEFRTPLTLILGPIEKWRAKTAGDDLQKDLSMMERNAHRLLRLINQLLDLSKIEAGGMKLQAAWGDIVPFIKGIAQSFQSSAGRRSIALRMEIEEEKIDGYFEYDKVEKILTNLLSNAFKFTGDGGEVMVRVRRARGSSSVPEENGWIEISIADTGIGISQEELSRVFDRFYQVDSSQTRGQEGSGIGLALTKELVEAHHGTISVTSEVGKGSEFTVRLPAGKAQYTPEEIVDAATTLQPPAGKEDVASFAESENITREVVDDTSQEKALVLIVEDNPDVRAYVKECLRSEYRILEARDGHEGMAYARESIPDLIISDVMMPKMDGNELCKTLKLDEKTSHVPVVLLTAKAGQENKIEGLETGADDFLVKPFDARELRVRVSNLIELRRKLRKRFSIGQVLKPGEIAVTSIDDAFLKKVIDIVERKLGEEDFSIEDFAYEVGMSRSQLHRKLTALTGLSPTEFLRYMRLHRAKELLTKNVGTVSEIAYTVGFSGVSYFTKCFREQFGVLPSEVKNT